MYRPVLTTAPQMTPISLQEAKGNARVDFPDDDDFITGLIYAATSYLDGWSGILGRCLEEQTWEQSFDRFARCMRLPLAPMIEIVSVKYDDVNGVEQTVDPSKYEILNEDAGPYVRFVRSYGFPGVDINVPSVRISYKAGYARGGDNLSTVPPAIRHAMLLMVGHWYENRGLVVIGQIPSGLPMAADALLAPFRRIRL